MSKRGRKKMGCNGEDEIAGVSRGGRGGRSGDGENRGSSWIRGRVSLAKRERKVRGGEEAEICRKGEKTKGKVAEGNGR